MRGFLNNPKPARAEALTALRGVFAAMFLSQAGVAALLAGVLALLTEARAPAFPLTSQVLVGLALLGLPVAATMAYSTARAGGKGAALAATLLAGVLLAVPAWFLAFAALVGSGRIYLTALLLVVVNAYAVGFLMCGRFAAFALMPKKAVLSGREIRQDEEADGLVEQV